MFEDNPMPAQPEDDLERMLAEDEAAILDEGFSKRVMDQVKPSAPWRQLTLSGAGLAGLGFAVGGASRIVQHFNLTGWVDGAVAAVRSTEASTNFQSASDPVQLAVIAIAAGLTFLVAAVVIQAR